MVLGQQFGDLDGVGRRPFSQVVADAPEREAVRVGEVFPDAADEDKVAAGAGAGHRVAALYFFVHDFDAGERREEFLCLFDRDRAFGFDEDRFAVAVGDRDAHARRADHDRLVTENLASLVDHLHLFAGVALFLEAADLRDGVERDRRLERLLFVGGLIESRSCRAVEIVRSGETRAADCLVGADDHAADSGCVVERLQRESHLCRRAVRAGDDPLRVERVLRVDLRNDQRHVVVHTEVARLIDHLATGGDRVRQVFSGNFVWRAGNDEIDTLERGGFQQFNRVVLTFELDRRPSTASRCQEPIRLREHRPLFQQLQHDATDRARRPYHRHRSEHDFTSFY